MERIEVNPSRLQWACEDRGITPADLAEAVSTGAKTIANAMAGQDGLTFNQLRNIAKFFNRGVLFFVEKGPVVEDAVRTPQFRTLTNQKPNLLPEVKSLIERAERHRDIFIGLRDELDQEDRGGFVVPKSSNATAAVAAAAARQWLKLGAENNFGSYRSAIESRGVLVFVAVGYFGEWRLPAESPIAGFSLYDERCPVILIKKQRSEARQSFTLMHELGHILLHRSSFVDEEQDLYATRGRERDANQFAGHLLVPDAFLQKIDDRRRPDKVEEIDNWLAPWRNQWGVSGEVILIRLMETGRVDRATYEAYRQWRSSLPIPEAEGGSREYRYREPIHLFGEKYVRTVLDAMHADRISLNKTSGFLDNLKVSDVRKLETHIAGL